MISTLKMSAFFSLTVHISYPISFLLGERNITIPYIYLFQEVQSTTINGALYSILLPSEDFIGSGLLSLKDKSG